MTWRAQAKIIGKLVLRARSSTQEVSIEMSPEINKNETPKYKDPQLKLVGVNKDGKDFLYYYIALKCDKNLEGREIMIPKIPFELKIY